MDKKRRIWPLIKRLLGLIKSYKRFFVISAVAVIILSFLSPLRPLLISLMVDHAIVKNQDPDYLLLFSLLIFCVLIVEGMLQVFSSYFSNLLAQNVILDLRKRVFSHIFSFQPRYFEKTPVGSLVTRVVSDLEAITDVFSAGIMEIAGDIMSLGLILTLMFATNWQLSVMTLIPIPLLLLATKIFSRAMRSSFTKERSAVNALNAFVQERLSGMRLVQLFNKEQKEYKAFVKLNSNHRKAHIQAIWANSIFFPVVEFLSSLSIAFLLVWGALHAQGKTKYEVQAMYGQIVAFTLWINQLYRPIRQLADKFNILQRGAVRAERLFEIIDDISEVEKTEGQTRIDFNKQISFNSVCFSYIPQQRVIKNLSLTINPGQTVAFVGATGSGKTTLISLLAKMYDYEEGEILIGGMPLKSISSAAARKEIGIVLQDVVLFSGTILENITMGKQEISKEQVIEATISVGLNDFINSLPGGYDHVISERGESLSVGQRQLISFIRAYVYNPTILILDEATSSVDSELEYLIQQATKKLTKERTSILVAHRLSTVQSADLICVMDNGKIIQKGTHLQLIQDVKGSYYKLCKTQFS
ncbi:MAG: ABC transporter ATP-binding protein [Bacteroidetes bacterium]|nr:ABC transporter ATP-binding protein [Bacteroidota bacterium]